jgi:cytochrome P450
MTSDPKAIQHIYANSNTFVRQTNNRELIKMIVGPGVTVVIGDAHKRQRRVMQPAFGLSHLKALFPVFMRNVQKVATAHTMSRFMLRLIGLALACHKEGYRCRGWPQNGYN